MEQSYHYLSMVNHSLFQKLVYSKIHNLELTPGQPKVLEYLSQYDGSIQRDIARGCQIEKATLTGILDRMEEKKLLERRCMDGNRRATRVFLTTKGQKQSEIIQQIFCELEKQIFANISVEEKEDFIKLMTKIHDNLSEMENE